MVGAAAVEREGRRESDAGGISRTINRLAASDLILYWVKPFDVLFRV